MKTLVAIVLLSISFSSFAICDKEAVWEAKKYTSMKLLTHTINLHAEIIENNMKYGEGSYIIDVYHSSNYQPTKLEVAMVEYADSDGCEKVEIKEINTKAMDE